MICNNPLVSVTVITYNSEKYVLETLESIKAQTYKDIELIISDDCSNDSTIELCKKWASNNEARFNDVQIISSPCNTGLSANCNRANKASHGEWIKGIAGDDILMPDCIETNINYIKSNPNTKVLFSQMVAFKIQEDGSIIENPFISSAGSLGVFFASLSAHEQYLALLDDKPFAITNAPTAFIKRDLVFEYPTNELYKYSEDVPLWINITKHGVHIDCIDKVTVKYRRGDSLSSSNKRFYSPLLWGSKRLHFWNELEGYLREEGLYDSYNKRRKQLLKIELLECLTKNKPTFFNKVLAIIIRRLVDYVNFPKF